MSVIFFLLTNFFLLFKLFLLVLIRLFLIPNVFAKYILLFLCFIVIFCLYKYPRTRFKKLSQVRNYKFNKLLCYAIKTKLEHIYNIFIIMLFTSLFTFAIFLLRYYNKNRIIDLNEIFISFKELYKATPLYDCIINILLFTAIFIIYVWLFTRILKYFKYQVIKRHIFFIGKLFEDTTTYKYIFEIFYQININQIHYKMINIIRNYLKVRYMVKFNKQENLQDFNTYLESENNFIKFYDKFTLNPLKIFNVHDKYNVLFHIMTKWHYILVFALILYDLFFNNYQITHVFNILPWTFFFELYIRFSNFINDLWIPHDQYLNTLLYAKHIEVWDKKTLLIDGEFYGYDTIKIIYKTYVLRDFKVDPNYM